MKATELAKNLIENYKENGYGFYNDGFTEIEINDNDYDMVDDPDKKYSVTPNVVVDELIDCIGQNGDFTVSRVITDDDGNVEVYELNESEIDEMYDIENINEELVEHIKEVSDTIYDHDINDDEICQVYEIIEDDFLEKSENYDDDMDDLFSDEEFEDTLCDAIVNVIFDDDDEFDEEHFNSIVNDYDMGIDYDEYRNDEDYDFEDAFETASLVGNIDDIDNLLEREYEKNLDW
jgi:hypothetical protein